MSPKHIHISMSGERKDLSYCCKKDQFIYLRSPKEFHTCFGVLETLTIGKEMGFDFVFNGYSSLGQVVAIGFPIFLLFFPSS